MNKFKVMIMFSSLLDIPAREGHDALSGVSVEYYFFGENGELVAPKISADGTSGTRRGKVFMDSSIARKINYVPGIYDGTFEMNVGSDGKPVLKMIDIDYVGKVSIAAEDKAADKGDKGNK